MRPALPVEPKNCEHCHAPMARKRYGDRLEDRAVYNRRRFCDLECSAQASLRPDAGRYALLGRKSTRKALKGTCERCGTADRLTIHHRDRDWRNNDHANLATLCAVCHTTLHHEQGDIARRKTQAPCRLCGKTAVRLAMYSTHLTRWKRYGDPRVSKRKVNGVWVLMDVEAS